MKDKLFIYPGSFNPPSYGHYNIAKTFVEQYEQPLIILCSENHNKENVWFTQEECKKMWKTYDLPENIKVMTLKEFKNTSFNKKNIVMVRGLRNEEDAEYEKNIMIYNKKEFNINQYLYIFGNESYLNISSSNIKNKVEKGNFYDLYLDVSYGVISYLWKHILNINSIHMVVGRPGSGKTTILNQLSNTGLNVKYINTDNYSVLLKPKLRQYFQEDNLFEIAKTKEQELINVIGGVWLELLFKDLMKIKDSLVFDHVLVEIAYGLQPHKDMFRYLGKNIIFINCEDNYLRNDNRNTEHLKFFIEKIPDLKETIEICNKNSLNLKVIETKNNSIEDEVEEIYNYICKKEEKIF
jgi:pantetheine-phosphate adenylyltransferase